MPLIEAVFGDAGSLGLGFEAESAKAAPKIKEIKTGTQAVQHTQLAVGMKLAEVGGTSYEHAGDKVTMTWTKSTGYAQIQSKMCCWTA